MNSVHPSVAVSIIIPCRNHARELDRCLRSLRAQSSDEPFEIIVVDSSSTDAVVAVTRNYPDVHLVRSEHRLMPGAARNLGARQSRGRILAFVDADCIVEADWIATLRRALETDCRAVGGAVLDGKPGNAISVIDNLMQFVDLHPSRKRGPRDLLPSCNIAIARTDFDAVGGFPELALPAGEDVLFCGRLRSRWKDGLHFEPAMQVRHFGRSKLREFWMHQICFGFCRGAYALELRPEHRQIARYWVAAPAVAMKRLWYLLSHAADRPAQLTRAVVLLPLLTVGVVAWSIGFRRGCLNDTLIQSVTGERSQPEA